MLFFKESSEHPKFRATSIKRTYMNFNPARALNPCRVVVHKLVLKMFLITII